MKRDPVAPPGRRIGLLGGSFDPPHAGHRHISEIALKRLDIDAVWWMVSPGNPLKKRGPVDLDKRMVACRAMTEDNSLIQATDLEARLGLRYTAETLEKLLQSYPGVRFMWMMGADNLAGFHKWKRWDAIMRMVPICVFARPGEQVRAGLSPAAQRFRDFRLPERAARMIASRKPPCWTMLSHPTSSLSSTGVRARGNWS